MYFEENRIRSKNSESHGLVEKMHFIYYDTLGFPID